MQNSDSFKKLINSLISAYQIIESEQPNQKIPFFGEYSREEITTATYYILKTESSDRFANLTEEEFGSLGAGQIISYLQEILNKPPIANMPNDLKEMVEILENNPPGEPSTSGVRVLDPQSPEERLKRILNVIQVSEAVDRVAPSGPGPQLIESKYADDIRNLIKDETKKRKFVEELTLKVGPIATSVYMDYLSKSLPSQDIAPLDVENIVNLSDKQDVGLVDIVKLTPQIDWAGKVIALPLAFNAFGRESLVKEVLQDESGFARRLEDNLRANGVEEGKIRSLVNEYVQKIKNLSSSDFFPVINSETGVIESIRQSDVSLDKAVSTGNFGNKTEVIQIAAKKAIQEKVPPIIPAFKGVGPEYVSPTIKIFDEITGTNIAQTLKSTDVRQGSEGYSFLLPMAAAVGGKYTAATGNPEIAIANDLFLARGVRSGDKDFELVVSRLNLTNEQLYLIKDHLATLEKAFPNYKPNINELSAIIVQRVTFIGGDKFTSGDIYENYTKMLPSLTGARGFVFRLGQQFFGRMADGFVDRAIRAGIAKIGSKIAGTAAATALKSALSAASSAIPIIGPVLGFIAGEILSRVLPFVKKYLPVILGGIGMIVGGLTLGGVGIILGGIGGFALGGGIMGGSVAAASTTVIAGFTALAGAFTAAIVVPLLIAVVGIPVSIALILFIINSGAYVVPPGNPIGLSSELAGLNGSSGTAVTSPYIDVVKIAAPAGPFQNGDVSLKEIHYKITVRAKKGALTNLKFQNTCQVIQKTGPYGRATCTAPQPPDDQIPEIISPAKNWTFEYVMDLSSYDDSFVVDTFTVTADTAEKKGEVAASSASVKIGNPPESCPSGWPVDPPIVITQGPQGTLSHIGYEAFDIAKNLGSIVRATHAGVVTVQIWETSYGHHVRINSSCGGKQFQSVYAHLDHILVSTGQVVTAGQIIGTVDSTGRSSGNHLHYELRPVLSGSNDGPVKIADEPLLIKSWVPGQ